MKYIFSSWIFGPLSIWIFSYYPLSFVSLHVNNYYPLQTARFRPPTYRRKKYSKEDMFKYCISEKLIKDIFESMHAEIYKLYKLNSRSKGPGANC